MADAHKYNGQNWTEYCNDKINKETRLEMTLHLSDCDICLDYYTNCIEANLSSAPSRIKKDLMKKVKKPLNTMKIMIAYATAACIATGLYSVGWLDKTIAYAPRGIEKSFKAIDVVSGTVNNVANKIIWRDSNGRIGKEK